MKRKMFAVSFVLILLFGWDVWCAKLYFTMFKFMQHKMKLFNQSVANVQYKTHARTRTYLPVVVLHTSHKTNCNVLLTAHWFNEILLPLPFSPFPTRIKYKLYRIFRASTLTIYCSPPSPSPLPLPNSTLHYPTLIVSSISSPTLRTARLISFVYLFIAFFSLTTRKCSCRTTTQSTMPSLT